MTYTYTYIINRKFPHQKKKKKPRKQNQPTQQKQKQKPPHTSKQNKASTFKKKLVCLTDFYWKYPFCEFPFLQAPPEKNCPLPGISYILQDFW